MTDVSGELLPGGLMNTPRKIGDVVHRVRTDSTETIHRLLNHVRSAGIEWVPKPLGVADGHEMLSFLPGSVPHEMPQWIWKTEVLCQTARFLREWHDATRGFDLTDAKWNLQTLSAHEIICHNDFAPYNCVFDQEELVGLIDFDLCAPGSRLWDMAYTAYRFVPVMPFVPVSETDDVSPFELDETLRRLDVFLEAYSKGDSQFRFAKPDLLHAMCERLNAIAEWTRSYAEVTSNPELSKNSVMYANHSQWIKQAML